MITNTSTGKSITRNQITDTVFPDCPIRNVLSHICGKWSLLVIYVMRQGDSIRFNALHRAIPDISQKVLTSTLRSLEADGFITRQVYAGAAKGGVFAHRPRPLVHPLSGKHDSMGTKQHGWYIKGQKQEGFLLNGKKISIM